MTELHPRTRGVLERLPFVGKRRGADPDVVDDLVEIVRATDDPVLAAHRVAIVLDQCSAFDATQAASSCALSDDPKVRRALAEALVWVFPLLGAGSILELLASDPLPEVRFAVARAAHARRLSIGDHVLQRLMTDPDSLVSGAAAFALATRP
ncbi:MAG TPA: hypothetical protein VFQ53_22930 [Kofleriaceae bacterium]|nr:hypothetical protein [Kofleriaceae bacterium]